MTGNKIRNGTRECRVSERSRKPVGPSEVALEVAGVGICGTDLHIWWGEYPISHL